jgi:hypothetical protein
LGIGLALGAPAAMALWWDSATWEGTAIQRGQVGFAVTREFVTDPPSESSPPHLVDGHGHGFSVQAGPDSDDGSSVGTTLSGPIASHDELEASNAPRTLYAKYVATGRADGDSMVTYAPNLTLPVDESGNLVQDGVTVRSRVLLYRAAQGLGDPDAAEDIECDEAFFQGAANPSQSTPVGFEYAGDPATGPTSSVNASEQAMAFSSAEQTSTDVWCLKSVELTHTNTAQVWAMWDSSYDGVAFTSAWSAVITGRSTDASDQLRIEFTPTVSGGSE